MPGSWVAEQVQPPPTGMPSSDRVSRASGNGWPACRWGGPAAGRARLNRSGYAQIGSESVYPASRWHLIRLRMLERRIRATQQEHLLLASIPHWQGTFLCGEAGRWLLDTKGWSGIKYSRGPGPNRLVAGGTPKGLGDRDVSPPRNHCAIQVPATAPRASCARASSLTQSATSWQAALRSSDLLLFDLSLLA